MSAVLERLHEAIDAVQSVDLGSLSNSELDQFATTLFAETSRLHAARSRAVEGWVNAGAWARDGALSPSQRLAGTCRLPVGVARGEVARARQRSTMPAAHAALAEGRINLDHLRLLGLANQRGRTSAYERDEVMLVRFCASLRFVAAKQAIEYWCHRVDADGVEDEAAEKVAANRLHVSQSLNGCWFLDGQLDPLSGTIVATEVERLAEQIRHEDERAGISRSPAERRAAALVRMAERSAARPKKAKKARVLVHVYAGEDSFSRLCELANGTVIPPGQLVPYLDRMAFDTLLFDGPSTVVSVTHTRTFTGALRTAVTARDRHCGHRSGCDVTAERCDVDHIVPYAAGGVTSQFNARLLCIPHNRLADLHDGGVPAQPHRDLTRFDELACRLRHHDRHHDPTDPRWHVIRIRATAADWEEIRRVRHSRRPRGCTHTDGDAERSPPDSPGPG